MAPFIPLALTLPLLSANPPLQERLQLGVEAPHMYSTSAGEVAAAVGGVLVGHLALLGVALDAENVPFNTCPHSDVTCTSPLLWISAIAAELVIAPGAAALFANLVSPDPFTNIVRAYGAATGVHLLCLLLTVPAVAVGQANSGVGVVLLFAVLATDLALTGATASWMLHDEPPPSLPPPAELPPETPPSPTLQPPPQVNPRVVVPLTFHFQI